MAEKLLNYDAVSAISYEPGDMAITLSPAQQSLAVQAVSLFAGGDLWQDYDTNSDAIDAAVADLMFALQDVTVPPPIGLQDRIFISHALSIVTAGNAFVVNTALGQMGDCQTQSPSAANDAWQSAFIRLRTGQWNMNMSWFRSPTSGQLHLYLDPPTGANIELFNTLEMYSATNGANRLNSATFDVPEATTYTLRGVVPSKNGASSAHNAFITFFDFVRIGD